MPYAGGGNPWHKGKDFPFDLQNASYPISSL